MGNLMQYARSELERAGLFDKDSDYGGMVGNAVLQLVSLFAEQGHSGFSAHLAITVFRKVVLFEPLTPLTGEEGEWNEIQPGKRWQNRRCSHVFRDDTGRAYDIDARVFREPSGATYTSRDSRVFITFPYVPKTEYVDVEVTE